MDPSQQIKRGRGRPKGQKNPPTAKNVGRRYKNGDPPIQRRNHVDTGAFLKILTLIWIYAYKCMIATMSTTPGSTPATPSSLVENLPTEHSPVTETGEKKNNCRL